MCGIAGWFSVDPRHESGGGRLQRLADALKHRGPDGISTLQIDHVGMMHARLAMVDLVSGEQPMWSADRSAVIVFNGEIYNYRELRAHYESRGAAFLSQSDTEVILAAYAIDGMAGFGRLRGMYAFALWDAVAGRGLLVRDPLGIKPLFVSENENGELRFASEAKGILVQAQSTRGLDETALHLLLNFRYVPGQASLFRRIRQLAPGECLEWSTNGVLRSGRVTPHAAIMQGSLDAVLMDSVRAHLVADVPVGCYLSGGIDSGVIAAMAGRSVSELRSFTLAVGDDPSEAKNAAQTAQILGLTNTQAALCDDELSRLPQMLWHLETPKVNAVQLFRLAELARTQVKAALSGVGGDELFAGYNVHHIYQTYSRLPRHASRGFARILRSLLPKPSVPYREHQRAIDMGCALGDWPHVYALLRNVWDRPELRLWLYGPRMLDAHLPDAVDTVRERWPRRETPLEAMAEYEWRNKMVNDLLWQEDRASMAAGLEVRVPFVDLAVYDAVTQMGRPRLGKAALKEVAAHYLPGAVLERPKSGFQVDAPAFFDTHLRPLAEKWLSPERVRRYGIFNPVTTANLLRLPIERRYRWHFFMVYLMIQVHMWIDIFENGYSPREIAGESAST
jgi:asparagine synthase (glutamine-hydrolysing)